MEISDEQIWDGEDSYAVFKSLMGEAFAPFATETVAEHNLTKMAEWGVSTLQGGVSAAKNVGFWDLSFKACLAAGTLQRDPGWISRADRNKQLQQEWDGLSVEQAKERYLVDGEFKRFVDSTQGGF